MLALKVQYLQYLNEHGQKAATWMLDMKVLGACQVWIDYYKEHGIEKLATAIEGKLSPLAIFEEAYHILVNRKAITSLKDLGNKTELQEEVLKMFPVTKSLKVHTQRCKLIYILTELPITIQKDF